MFGAEIAVRAGILNYLRPATYFCVLNSNVSREHLENSFIPFSFSGPRLISSHNNNILCYIILVSTLR